MSHSIWRDLLNTVRTWWDTDRIRVSPNDGRLLRIQPGDLMTIEGLDIEVLDRSLNSTERGELLQLNCRGPLGTATLTVAIDTEVINQKATWAQSGFERPIDLDEIQIWSRRLDTDAARNEPIRHL
jgi:hypothetical protein